MFLLGLFSTLFLSCEHELKEGIIINKYEEPERTYLYMMPIPHTVSSGKTTSTYFTYIPIIMHDDRDFVIIIHGLTDNGQEKDERFYLPQSIFDQLKLGQHFCVTDDCDKEPNEDKKLIKS